MAFSTHQEMLLKVGALERKCTGFGLRQLLFLFINALIMAAIDISSFSFIVKYFWIDLKSTLFGILQFSAATAALYSLMMISFHWQRILEIVQRIDQIQSKFFKKYFFLFRFHV